MDSPNYTASLGQDKLTQYMLIIKFFLWYSCLCKHNTGEDSQSSSVGTESWHMVTIITWLRSLLIFFLNTIHKLFLNSTSLPNSTNATQDRSEKKSILPGLWSIAPYRTQQDNMKNTSHMHFLSVTCPDSTYTGTILEQNIKSPTI